LRKAAFDDATGAEKNEACGVPSALVGSGFDDAAVVGISFFFFLRDSVNTKEGRLHYTRFCPQFRVPNRNMYFRTDERYETYF